MDKAKFSVINKTRYRKSAKRDIFGKVNKILYGLSGFVTVALVFKLF